MLKSIIIKNQFNSSFPPFAQCSTFALLPLVFNLRENLHHRSTLLPLVFTAALLMKPVFLTRKITSSAAALICTTNQVFLITEKLREPYFISNPTSPCFACLASSARLRQKSVRLRAAARGYSKATGRKAKVSKATGCGKANLIQILLLLTKLKIKQKSLFKKSTIQNNSYLFGKLDEYKAIPQKILKPFSTVTGFKKFMSNFVKISQNQLQPSYNRRRSNHSHYNQILKESTRLSRIYAYLSKPQMKTYCAFTIKPNSSFHYLPLLLLRELLPGCYTPTKSLSSPLLMTKLNIKQESENLRQGMVTFGICTKGKRAKQVFPAAFGFQVFPAVENQRPQGKLENQRPQQEFKNLSSNSLSCLRSPETITKSYAQLDDYDKPAALKPSMAYSRPIPRLVNFLESRLDVILWRNQLSNSIRTARQKLRQGIHLNGSLQKKPSFQALPGDVFSF